MRVIYRVLFASLLLVALFGRMAMAEETTDKKPEVEVRFFYLMCNDVAAMRGFYTDLLGMSETNYYNEPEMGWLCYAFGDIEFMFFRAENALPVPDKYAS